MMCAKSMSMHQVGHLILDQQFCFIDEADFLSPNAQVSLRYIIEKSSKRWRFLFTANNIRKFGEAIRSKNEGDQL